MILKILGNRVGDHGCTKWNIGRCQPLGHGQDIWLNSPMLNGKPFAGAHEATHHFIGDQQDAIFVTQCPNTLHVARTRDENAIGANNWFDNDCRNRLRSLIHQHILGGI